MNKSIIQAVSLIPRKDGKGNVCRANFADPNTGLRASRLYHESFATILKPGMEVEVEIQKVETPAYTFLGADGKEVSATSKSIAILKGESVAQATLRSIPSGAKAPASADVATA